MAEFIRTEEKERIGEWIKDDGDWFETMFKCSECGSCELGTPPFCSKCGSYNEYTNQKGGKVD